jgi:hypothetical protein
VQPLHHDCAELRIQCLRLETLQFLFSWIAALTNAPRSFWQPRPALVTFSRPQSVPNERFTATRRSGKDAVEARFGRQLSKDEFNSAFEPFAVQSFAFVARRYKHWPPNITQRCVK